MTADRLDLDALEALEAAATEGEWMLDTADVNARFHVATVTAEALRGEDPAAEVAWGDYDGNVRMRPADAALIVALRNAAPALIAAAREAERLTRWQAEAMTVLGEWREAWNAAGKPGLLGASMASGMLAEVTKVRSERDAAQAALARVVALHVRDSLFTNSCAECSDFGTDAAPIGALVEWPCATIRALRGEGQEAGGK